MQASKKLYNKCSENSRSNRLPNRYFPKIDVGCPDCWLIYNTNVAEGISRLDGVNNTTSPEDIKKKNLIFLKAHFFASSLLGNSNLLQ